MGKLDWSRTSDRFLTVSLLDMAVVKCERTLILIFRKVAVDRCLSLYYSNGQPRKHGKNELRKCHVWNLVDKRGLRNKKWGPVRIAEENLKANLKENSPFSSPFLSSRFYQYIESSLFLGVQTRSQGSSGHLPYRPQPDVPLASGRGTTTSSMLD